MQGIIVAVNRNIGVVVVETSVHKCVVLETKGRITLNIGEELAGDWDMPGEIIVHNLANGDEIRAEVHKINVSRSEAVGSMSFF